MKRILSLLLSATLLATTVYYNGNGERITNLGVHEHWNNPTDKQYSRNLGADQGIELIQAGPSPETPGIQSFFRDVAKP